MSTILGPAPCRDCRAHVWVVRRTVEVPCPGDYLEVWNDHTHAIPDVAWTVVDADGERHRCAEIIN